MTERIDLDDIETDGDDQSDTDHDAWLQHSGGADPGDAGADDADQDDANADDDEGDDEDSAGAIPRVPRENENRPAGVPTGRGGSGAGASTT